MGDEEEPVAVLAPYGGVERLTQAGGAFGHGVEQRLDVRRRAADDAEDLARRRLLLQGLGKVAVARLQLLEQADVLDGDDGLRGEGLEERDLLVGERPDLCAAKGYRPDHRALSEQGDGKGGSMSELVRGGGAPGNSSVAVCKSGTWMLRRSMIERP